MDQKLTLWFKEITIQDVPLVGGKNAALGEMLQKLSSAGVPIPDGFAVTAEAYDYFVKFNNLEEKIKEILKDLDTHNIENLQEKGRKIRELIKQGDFPDDLKNEILEKFDLLQQKYGEGLTVAVRSSATAEDLPDASFAGQQETYLNVDRENLLSRIKDCFASLFTDRAISYRQDKGFDHFQVKLSVGVQKMVRSDVGASGVAFTIDPDNGLKNVIVINGVFGLGELIVQGKVVPDEWIIFKNEQKNFPIISQKLGEKNKKIIYQESGSGVQEIETTEEEKRSFSLTENEVRELAKYCFLIEKHFQKAMDIEWAKDGIENKLYIVQARPETVHSTKGNVWYEYRLKEKGEEILRGIAIGSKITTGKVRVIKDVEKINEFQKGEILVTEITDPDWEPIMKIASGIITERGGRTCFSGDTKILTNKGFLPIKSVVELCKKDDIKVLSLNRKTLQLEWKKVLRGMKRRARVITINISQTGRMKENFLKVTPDHKFLTFNNRILISKTIEKILKDKNCVLSCEKIVKFKNNKSSKLNNDLAYFLGGICTDGNVYLNKNHGEVQFIQKKTPQKMKFIYRMNECLKNLFGYSFHESKEKISRSCIKGRVITGSATKYRCYSKSIATYIKEFQNKLSKELLFAPESALYNFLAGVIDGDGSYNKNRINIFCSKNELLESIVIACLRLGINYQISKNRNVWNVQIVDKLDEIFQYTTRVKGNYQRIKFGVKFFAAKQLFEDIIERVNYKGRIKPYVLNNYLIDAEKIRNYIIPLIKGEVANHETTKIINSPLKMLRVSLEKGYELTDVYNIEVADNHNYIVFTNRYTPVIVENCHAAIVSRELGIPAVVGAQGATEILKTGEEITIDNSTGLEGKIYRGILNYEVIEHRLDEIPETKTKVYVNIGEPDEAMEKHYLPVKGVGLAREEFIIASSISIHPKALIDYPNLPLDIKEKIEELTKDYEDKKQYFVDRLAEGIAKIAVSFYPNEVIVRFSDFKTNEYRNLLGGELYEPQEENPMIGWRGASRYYHPDFVEAFKLEVLAFKKVIKEFGLNNVVPMVPFCRTPEEGRRVVEIIESILGPRENYKIYVMAEIPSNILLADEFLEIFDGMSIGSNDLTQLVLGIDRDNQILTGIGDERNPAVLKMISELIDKCKEKNKYIGICGQAPSDFPEIVEFLVKKGIDSISVNPDVVMNTLLLVKKFEDENR